MKEINKTIVIVASLICISVVISVFIYSNNDRFDNVTAGNRAYVIDKRTGQTWVMVGRTKTEHEINDSEPSSELSEPINLPDSELDLLEIRATLSSTGYFEADVYNGSNYRIKNLDIRIWVTDNSDAYIIDRIYSLTPSYIYSAGSPVYQSTEFSSYLGFNWGSNSKRWGYSIVGAKGYKVESN